MAYAPDHTALEMAEFPIQGNVIDHTWHSFILREIERDPTDDRPKPKAKPDSVAIMLLAEIVYWYRPKIERDLISNNVTVTKKYKADLLQLSYDQLEERLGFTQRQLVEAFKTLERLDIARRVLRTITVNGITLSNVLFISLNHKNLMKLRKECLAKQAAEFKKCESSHEIPGHPPTNNVTPPTEFVGTYTESTKERTTEKTQQQPAAPAAVFSCLSDLEMPTADKQWISANYPDATVQHAVKWATHPSTPIKKSLAQAIKWACKEKPAIPKAEVDTASENRALAQEMERRAKSSTTGRIDVCSQYVEIVPLGVAACESICIQYTSNGFREQLENAMRKRGLL